MNAQLGASGRDAVMPAAGSNPAVWAARLATLLAAAVLAGCGVTPRQPVETMPVDAARAAVVRVLPATLGDRSGWANDVVNGVDALGQPLNAGTLCAVLAVTEQESTYSADPAVPNLAGIARKEIDARAERAGVPLLAVSAALALRSSDGRSYAERLESVRTERELSEIYEDFIDQVPLGKRFLASRNPVRTGGPMQVAVSFAERQAATARYPYPVRDSIRHEVFTRRGGLYFGAAHLLDYEAPYEQMLYRFADFNAGRWASRNAAFQLALTAAGAGPVVPDGDLLPPGADADRPPGATEQAVVSLARALGLSLAQIRRDLERGEGPGFERSDTWKAVYALAEQKTGKPPPMAALPRISLQSPKIRRALTTEWFARRVDDRYQRCRARWAPAP